MEIFTKITNSRNLQTSTIAKVVINPISARTSTFAPTFQITLQPSSAGYIEAS